MANADGAGSATTTVEDVTLEELPQLSTDTTFESLPSSGGLPPVALLTAPVVLLIVSISAVFMLLRFRA